MKTSVAQLVDEFERLGVRLYEEENKLRFRAPKGVMTEPRLERLRSTKDAVLEYLRQGPSNEVLEVDLGARHEPFPLTDVQAAYLVGRGNVFAYGGVGCHAYGELAYEELDPVRLDAAWNALIRRHEMLRAVIDPAGSQRILAEAPPLTIPVTDLRYASDAAAATHLDATRAAMDHRVYEPNQWPLFDLRLTMLASGARLHFSLDFLIADYASIQVILDDLHRLYAEPGSALDPIEVSFRDYLVAERRLRASGRYERDRAYWWKRIDELPLAPELPTLARSDVLPRFGRRQLELDTAGWSAFRRHASTHALTPSTALLAAYAEVIGRFSQSPRFSINVTLGNRLPLHPHVDRLVGDFTSVSLLAVEDGATLPFAERAIRIRTQLFDDLDHRLCSGVEVMRELARRRGGAAAALMPVVFTSALKGGDVPTRLRPGKLVAGVSQTPQVWIDCQAMEDGRGLSVNWDVRDGVFPDGLIDCMFEAFSRLVRALATGQAWTDVDPMPLPTDQAERRRAVNATTKPLPEGLLHEGLIARALRTPEATAVIAGGTTLSYRELVDRASAVAAALRGAAPGRPIAIVMDKGHEQVVGALGALFAGGAYLPIDITQPRARRDEILADAGVRQVLTQSRFAGNGFPPNLDVIVVDALGSAALLAARTTRSDELAYVMYTSGSTGKPKGVMISHRGALNTIVDVNQRFAVGPGDRVLGLASLGFDLSVYDIFGLLRAGGTLVLPNAERRGDPSHWAELILTHAISIWNSVPAQMQMLHDYLTVTPDASIESLRLVLLSGDWIPVSLSVQVRKKARRARVISLGGATEASIWSIIYPIEALAPAARSVPYGKPLANQTFAVLDRALRPCPEQVKGELYIGGAGLALGYLDDEGKTAERFITHPHTGERLYRTGDMGRYLPDGNIEFLGREDAQVKIRGHRIELGEIEAVLARHPGVGNAAVIVEGAPPLERRLVAFVEPAIAAAPAPAEDPLREQFAQLGRDAAVRTEPERIAAFARQLDELALFGMIACFRVAGLFTTPAEAHTLKEILARTHADKKHHRLMRRWLAALEKHGLVAQDPGRGYHGVPSIDSTTVDAAWDKVMAVPGKLTHRSELLDYFRNASRHLPALVRGDIDPLQLLFPEGRLDIQESAYAGNQLADYLNQLVAASVASVVAAHGSGARVLEIGAGVGGTSVAVLEALALYAPHYMFTDVSQFFLNKAAEKFACYPWVKYGIFDLNVDHLAQGVSSNSYDVIICANVLHYARNATLSLGRIREMLRPGGHLVFIETTRDNYQILTSMEFLFDATHGDFEDVRNGRDATFIERAQWQTLLAETGAEPPLCLPDADDPLAEIGMYVFVARYKADRVCINEAGLVAHLRAQLPEYMVPSQIEWTDALPLSSNGKVDRKALRVPMKDAATESNRGDEPQGDLEVRIAALWAEMLRLKRVARDTSFFELGGDSLLAAQLVGLLREKLVEASGTFYDSLLREMLAGPTVASLATHLSASRSAAEAPACAPASDKSPLVTINEVAGKAVGVLFHDGSGGLASYARFIAALGDRVPLVGFVIPDRAVWLAESPEGAMLRLASDYVRRLRELPARPYHLIGYHSGALLATEVARQLTEANVEVAGLTVISSYPMPCLVSDEILSEYLFVRGAGLDPVALSYPGEAMVGGALFAVLDETPDHVSSGAIDDLVGDHVEVARRWRELRNTARAARLQWIGVALDMEPASVEAALEVFRHGQQVATLHRVWPFAGDITLVLHREPTPLWPPLRDEMTGYWQRICVGDLTIEEVAGDHFSCMASADVGAIVDRVIERTAGARR